MRKYAVESADKEIQYKTGAIGDAREGLPVERVGFGTILIPLRQVYYNNRVSAIMCLKLQDNSMTSISPRERVYPLDPTLTVKRIPQS